MSSLWQKHEIDGRIGYPEIAVYTYVEEDGTFVESPVPPMPCIVRLDGTISSPSYQMIIKEFHIFEELFATGFWHSPEHVGPVKLIDNAGNKPVVQS